MEIKNTKNKPNCFIAMRFGATDTDTIYLKYIEPTVRKLGLNPIRIDKIEHNENIDEKIITELNRTDIVIADLTYARPSVYYEAGYAERKVPVIYTCRRDHLDPISPLRVDISRVHFDLEHKNIIDWLDILDNSFQSRLEGRIKHLIEIISDKTLLELESFLFDLKSSLSNPDHIFNRAKNFHEALLKYKRPDINDQLFEEKTRQRAELLTKFFHFLESQNLDEVTFHNFLVELFPDIKSEIEFLNNQLNNVSYGQLIFLASIQKELHHLYLKVSQRLYQRPSAEYEAVYNQIRTDIEKLISTIKNSK